MLPKIKQGRRKDSGEERTILWLVATLNVLLVIAAFLPRLRIEHWCVRGFDFPRLQFATVALVLLLAELVFLDLSAPLTWLLVLASLTSLVLQARWIWPYTPLHPKEVQHAKDPKPERCLRLFVANVLTPNRRSQKLLEIIRDQSPDVIVTVETDDWWQDQLDVLMDEYPHRVGCPLDNLYGMTFYSRLPIRDTKIRYLVQQQVPSIHTCLTLPSGQDIELHCVHPAPPSPTENDLSAARDAELVMVGRSVRHSDKAVIVTGDLNDVAWSSTTRLFRKVSGLLDPRIGRGMFNTFHARWPFIRWPLDHLFHSAHFSLVHFQRLPAFGSDHRPILVELALNLDPDQQNSFAKRDYETQLRAQKKLREEHVSGDDVPNPG